MQVNKPDDFQECFVDQEGLEIETVNKQQITVGLNHRFYQQLPPNQLRTARRPDTMAPRTFFLERPFQKLITPMQEPCTEQLTEVDGGKLKLKVVNKNNLTLEEYFKKKKFKCVYNRLQHYRADCKTFQGRLKGIDALIDYNWKSFKQLDQQSKLCSGICQDSIDADFESGNTVRAYVNPEEDREFYLLIQNDLNTYGYNNWFFFRVKNTSKGLRRFTIANMVKKTNFFSNGMLISIFSTKKNRQQGCQWFKGGERITFGSINLPRNHHFSDNYYSLSFQYDFQHEEDEVFFSLNQPYTYSRLVSFISASKTIQSSVYSQMEVKTVGYSVSNNIIPTIKLSKPSLKNKELVLILARQHPCQTVGSFIAEELIRNLMGNDSGVHDYLFNSFDFVFIPMVNPDGVIHGSSRCNMAGLDLNRQWGELILKQLTPQTVKIKQYIMALAKTYKIKYMIDLHGHGKKLNSFFFSCKDNQKDDVRLFSTIMRKMEPRFNFYDCTYGISKDKQNTIRSTINAMGITHSYTLQTSLYGWKDQHNQIRHFNQQDYRHISKSLLESIFILEANPSQTMKQLGYTKEGIMAQFAHTFDKSNKETIDNCYDNQILSESDPEGDKLDVKDLLGSCQNKAIKKKLQDQIKNTKGVREKKAKGKAFSNTRCYSNKNMRQTLCSAISVKTKLSIANSTLYPKEQSTKANSNKKISLTQKWKTRRKQIEKKKVMVQQKQFQQKQMVDKLNDRPSFTRLEERTRIKTQTKGARPFRAHLPHSTYLKSKAVKNRQTKSNIKSEFKEIENYVPPSEEQVMNNQSRKSALELKFSQLKQESLNVLLTDTLSILKIKPSEKEKDGQDHRETKRCSVKINRGHLATEPALQTSSKVVPSQEPAQPQKYQSPKLKRLRQLQNGQFKRKESNSLNSVFYYFPIL